MLSCVSVCGCLVNNSCKIDHRFGANITFSMQPHQVCLLSSTSKMSLSRWLFSLELFSFFSLSSFDFQCSFHTLFSTFISYFKICFICAMCNRAYMHQLRWLNFSLEAQIERINNNSRIIAIRCQKSRYSHFISISPSLSLYPFNDQKF